MAQTERTSRRRPWTIVLAVDDSPASVHAVQWVADLASELGATVVMITATKPSVELLNDSLPMGPSDWRHRLRRRLHNEWAAPLQAKHVTYRTRLVEKTPGNAILSVAAEEHADVIALGTHRRHWVPGSLSAYLTGHAPCPVVTIPLPGATLEPTLASVEPLADPAT